MTGAAAVGAQPFTVQCDQCGGPMTCRSTSRVASGEPMPTRLLRRHYQCHRCEHEADAVTPDEPERRRLPAPRPSIDADDLPVAGEDSEPPEVADDPVGQG